MSKGSVSYEQLTQSALTMNNELLPSNLINYKNPTSCHFLNDRIKPQKVTTTFIQNVQQKWRNLTVRCEMQSNYTIQLFYTVVKIVVRQIAHRKTYKHKNSNYQIHTIQHNKTQNDIHVSPWYIITKYISLTWYASKELPLIESIKQDMKFHSYIIYSILQNNKIIINIH